MVAVPVLDKCFRVQSLEIVGESFQRSGMQKYNAKGQRGGSFGVGGCSMLMGRARARCDGEWGVVG
eukprot:scaffold312755_cov17-Tisochrysis_lutea.AAC.1